MRRELGKRHISHHNFGLSHSTPSLQDGASTFSKKLCMLLLAFTSMNRVSFFREQHRGSLTAVQRSVQGRDVAMIEQAQHASWPIAEISERKSFLQGKGLHMPAGDIDGTSTSKACLSDAVVKLVAVKQGAYRFVGTGSIISAKGLILTNQHVVIEGDDQASDNKEEGFVAKDLPNEITTQFEAWITRSYVDVSDRFVHSTSEPDPIKRMEANKIREQEIISEAKAACDASTYCEVLRMWPKSIYVLITYERLRDVRLVYLPPFQVASKDVRALAADIALLRAYVAPDGSVAKYSPNNVPHKPAMFLNLAPAGVEEGDFVFTLGYPAFSRRYASSIELDCMMEPSIPKQVLYFFRRMEEDRLCSAKPEAEALLNKLEAVYEDLQKPDANQTVLMQRGQSMTLELLELYGGGDFTPDFNGCLRFSVGEVTSFSRHMKPASDFAFDLPSLNLLLISLYCAGSLLYVWKLLQDGNEASDILNVCLRLIANIVLPIYVLRTFDVDVVAPILEYNSKWALPSEVLELRSSDEVKQIPVVTRAALDAAGGASGSPILNSRGQLVAVLDSSSELVGDGMFRKTDYQDAVDLRYALLIIGEYSGAQWLVEEMTSLH